jgi:hypothetical protein
MFLRNVVPTYLQVHKELQPRRPTLTSSPSREPQIPLINFDITLILFKYIRFMDFKVMKGAHTGLYFAES